MPQVLDGLLKSVTCTDLPVILEPQGYFWCSGYYVLTQEDIDQGIVTHEVTKTVHPEEFFSATGRRAVRIFFANGDRYRTRAADTSRGLQGWVSPTQSVKRTAGIFQTIG